MVDGRTVGVVFHSPSSYGALVTPTPDEAVIAAVDAIAEAGVTLPGVNGDAATAARFAGQWAERTRSPVAPVHGQRIYEVDAVVDPRPTTGGPRAAVVGEEDLIVEWVRAFHVDVGEPERDASAVARRRLAAGHLWIWEDTDPVALAGVFGAVAGVARVGPVYTPPDRRGRGYASALVTEVSQAVRARGDRCILYTDLDNPTSNSIYRALGYRAVAEALKYRFDAPR